MEVNTPRTLEEAILQGLLAAWKLKGKEFQIEDMMLHLTRLGIPSSMHAAVEMDNWIWSILQSTNQALQYMDHLAELICALLTIAEQTSHLTENSPQEDLFSLGVARISAFSAAADQLQTLADKAMVWLTRTVQQQESMLQLQATYWEEVHSLHADLPKTARESKINKEETAGIIVPIALTVNRRANDLWLRGRTKALALYMPLLKSFQDPQCQAD